MIDIVIPYKHNKKEDGDPLRYTLRSIEKNFSGYGKIFLVGDKPDWIHNVTHIPCEDFPNHKQSSIANKMLLAAHDERVSENYIRWDDDHFLLKKVDEIKPWHSGTVKGWLGLRHLNGYYRDVVNRTFEAFGDVPYYDIHTPVIINKQAYIREMSEFVNKKHEMLVKTTYLHKIGATPTPFEKDLKIDTPCVHWQLYEMIQGRTFFSVGEHGFNFSMKRVLSTYLYPNKSIYETNICTR